MNHSPHQIEILKRRLREQQMIRKRIEMQLQKNKKIQQRIQQEMKKQQQNPHHEVLSQNQQIELLNNPNFIASLPPPQPQVVPEIKNTLTIRLAPKPVIRPKITPPVKLKIPETPKIENTELVIVENSVDENKNKLEEECETEVKIYYKIPIHSQIPKNSPKIPNIQIYGAFNTGTNLLTVLFEKLFHIQVPRVGSAKKWKHTLEIQHFPNYFHILVLKNPFSWFQSMKKESYNLQIPNRNNLLHHPVPLHHQNQNFLFRHHRHYHHYQTHYHLHLFCSFYLNLYLFQMTYQIMTYLF
jgi:hypothetical protein